MEVAIGGVASPHGTTLAFAFGKTTDASRGEGRDTAAVVAAHERQTTE